MYKHTKLTIKEASHPHLAQHMELVRSLAADISRVSLGHDTVQAYAFRNLHIRLAHGIVRRACLVLAVDYKGRNKGRNLKFYRHRFKVL